MNTELHWNTISENMRLVLEAFTLTDVGRRFYLAGGSALALQLGHRRSLDLDFFSPTDDITSLRLGLETALAPFQPSLADSAWGNLVYLANDVRLGYYGYGHPLVAPLLEHDQLRLASVEDIALMKLDALLSRAARKDFYDLYFICLQTPLRQLLDLAPQKYPHVRDFEVQTVKRLIYFANAESEPDPILLQPVTWEVVKDYFVQQARSISASWL